MITLYSGTPGSGKSYHVAQRICNVLRYHRDRVVVTNIRLNLACLRADQRERVIYVDNFALAPERLRDISEHIRADRGGLPLREGTILLVLDECQLLYNARTWQLNDNKGWIAFYTQHRKLGYDVIMIAQYDRMIDRQIRSLIEYEVVHRKLSCFGLRGRVLSLLFGNFVAVHYWYGIREIVQRDYLRYNKRIGALYDTYQTW